MVNLMASKASSPNREDCVLKESIMSSWKTYLCILPIFLMLDLLWLGVIMKGFYSQELGDLVRRNGASMAPRWGSALLVYLLIPGGIVLFVRPILREQSTVDDAILWGALFGLVLYGVYDLTNLAVLEQWTVVITVADMLWGTAICAATTAAMRVVDNWMRT